MYRILVSDKLGAAGLELLESSPEVEFDLKTGLSPDELLAIISDYDALIVRSGTQVTAAVIKAGARLKVIGRAGMGVDNIDVPAATQQGIVVMNTPGANSVATAELALGLMLSASRHIPQAHGSLQVGEWRRSEFVGSELKGKVLGLIGFGRIGRLVAIRAQAFGMEVIAYDPYISDELGQSLAVTMVDLDDLLARSDYISLHTAVTPETEGMINAELISRMKPEAILINAARGKLIDDEALAEALKTGRLKAAAIDVYRQEPPAADHPILGLPNVTATPHLGASTVEAQRTVAREIVQQVIAALEESDFSNAVNMPFEI